MKLLHAHIQPSRRLRSAALALTLAAAGLISLSPAAQASATPTAAPSLAGAAAHPGAVHSQGTLSWEATVSYGGNSCTIYVDSASVGPGGIVEGDGSVSCTYAVYKIDLATQMFYGSTPEGSGTELAPLNTRFVTETASAAHISGTWETVAEAYIYWTNASSYQVAGPVESVPDSL